jgi:hypothetical protein
MSIKGLWAAFKAWQFFKEATKDGKKEVVTMEGTKPGWKTTEFWVTVFTTGGSLLGQVQGVIPEPWGVIAAAFCTFGYTVARALTKKAE